MALCKVADAATPFCHHNAESQFYGFFKTKEGRTANWEGFYCFRYYVHQGFHQVWYQGIVKATVSGVFEDLKF